ncbi:Or9e41 [Eciton burchellii]|nr:Or9e41 [Eciton burchellii]
MICVKDRYLRYNRIALLTVGLWPYQQSSNLLRLQLVLSLGSLISFIVFQLSRLLFAEYSLEFIIKMFSIVIFFIALLIKHLSFSMNMKAVRYLIERLQYVHNELQDGNEIAIYDKYGNVAKRFTIMLIFVMCNVFVIIGIQCYPYFYDIIISKNGTHTPYLIALLSKYYVMEEKYFDILIVYYVLILHMSLLWIVGMSVLVSTGTMLLSYLICTYGMFKIASYRLGRAIISSPLRSVSLKKEFMIYKQIIYSVDIHHKAMESVELFRSNFDGIFFLLIVIAVCCLTLNLFRIFQIISHTDEIDKFLIFHVAVIITIFIYISLGHYIGQEITDVNNEVFFIAYSIQWYTASLNIQKMILFLLQRGSKMLTMKFGLFIASLECLASMITTSISYFTVIYTNQK